MTTKNRPDEQGASYSSGVRVKWRRLAQGLYRSKDGRFEIESVRRRGGGGSKGEWVLSCVRAGENVWMETAPQLKAAKSVAARFKGTCGA